MAKNKDQKVGGILGWIERVGNALPHPAAIFIVLSVVLIVVAHFMAMRGVSVDFYNARTGETEIVEVVSLLNPEGIRYILNSAVTNFGNYSPLAVLRVLYSKRNITDIF